MYEKAGLSSLERLVGKEVSSVCFVRDYLQIVFEELILTCYTLPALCISGELLNPNVTGYRDKLCELIGKSVQSVVERQREELAIYFERDDNIRISLRFEDAASVEAAMLHQLGGEIFDVWRYE